MCCDFDVFLNRIKLIRLIEKFFELVNNSTLTLVEENPHNIVTEISPDHIVACICMVQCVAHVIRELCLVAK